VSRAPRSATSDKLVVDEPLPGVARLRIANPRRRGALDAELLTALADAFTALDARCVILTGTDEMFSAGYDLHELDPDAPAEQAEYLVAPTDLPAFDAMDSYPYPIIAAVNGHALGGGLELALTCDLRLAARSARVGMPAARLGLVYSHTGLERFLELCGPAVASELFLVGRPIDAEHAERVGLVNRVVDDADLEATVLDLAAEMAGNAALSVRGNKAILRALRRARENVTPQLEHELVALRDLGLHSADFAEGVRAFQEKRPPRWVNR